MINTRRASGVWYAWYAWDNTPDHCDGAPYGIGRTKKDAISNCKFLHNRRNRSFPDLPRPVYPRGKYWKSWVESPFFDMDTVKIKNGLSDPAP
jgi:hypothetical protein